MTARLSLSALLKEAARFLDGDRSDAPGAPLCAALLARESLELAIQAWARTVLGVRLNGVSGRATLTVLDGYLDDPELSARARYAWMALSSATHHSALGDARGAGEVRDLAVDVAQVIRGLSRDAAARQAATP